MLIYVIRHGQSETNLQQQWTGWLDAPLTEKGRKDAEKAREFLKNISFDKVYCSDLRRAKETAAIAAPHWEAEPTALLREVNVGTLAGQPLSVLTKEQDAHIFEVGYGDYDGETQEAFAHRVATMMEQVAALPCTNVALFSHAGWLRGMLDIVLGLRLPRGRVRCRNCTIAVFEYTDGVWSLHSWVNL